jgi:hypothetical protein
VRWEGDNARGSRPHEGGFARKAGIITGQNIERLIISMRET